MSDTGFTVNASLFANAQTNLKDAINEFSKGNNLMEDLESSFPSEYNYRLEVSDIIATVRSVKEYNIALSETAENIKNQLIEIDSSWAAAYLTSKGEYIPEEEPKWYEDLWNATKDTASAWGKGIVSLFSGEGFGYLGDALIETGATIAVVGKSVTDGIAKLEEYILVDGLTFIGGSLTAGGALLYDAVAGTDYASQIMDGTLDFVRKDLVGEANENFYNETELGRIINENSNLKYDSAGAQTIYRASEFTAKVALAVGATVMTGGAAAPIVLGTMYGVGEASESYAQGIDRENGEDYNYAEAALRTGLGGVTGAMEFYGYGQLGSMVISNGAQLMSTLKNSVQNLSANGINSALSEVGNLLKNISPKQFASNFASNFFEWDNILDVGCVVADHGISFAFGDESLEELIKLGGMELLFALGLNALGSAFGSMVQSATPDVDLDDIVTVPGDNLNVADNLVEAEYVTVPTVDMWDEVAIVPANISATTFQLNSSIPASPNLRNLTQVTQLGLNDNYRAYAAEIKASPSRFYQKNYNYFQTQGISFQEYLSEMGINVNSYSTSNAGEAAVAFNDRTMYLVNRAQEILQQQTNSRVSKEWTSQVKSMIGTETGIIDDAQLESLLLPFLTSSDISNLSLIGKNSLKDVLTPQQFASIFQYTQAGGNNVVNYLRGDYSMSLTQIENRMNSYQMGEWSHGFIRSTLNGTIIDDMTSILDAHANEELLTAVRYVGDLGPNVSLDINNLNALVGQTIYDKGFGSFTLLEDATTYYSKTHNIMIKAYIDPGSGCLIQNASGLSSNINEFLVNRSYNQTIIDAYIDPVSGKTVIETILSLEEK